MPGVGVARHLAVLFFDSVLFSIFVSLTQSAVLVSEDRPPLGTRKEQKCWDCKSNVRLFFGTEL